MDTKETLGGSVGFREGSKNHCGNDSQPQPFPCSLGNTSHHLSTQEGAEKPMVHREKAEIVARGREKKNRLLLEEMQTIPWLRPLQIPMADRVTKLLRKLGKINRTWH